jgi:exodeoxyribonuclease-5
MKELFFAIEEDFLDVRSRKTRYDLIMKTPHMNALQVKFSYAVTCHKSQGGQWPAVFIDQGYLTEEMLDKEYMRWLYTAVTRATDKLYFVNFSKMFYEGEEDV